MLASLTYQQKQLVRDGEYSAVLHSILRKRRISNFLVSALALFFGYVSFRAIVSGTFPWLSSTFCIFFSWWVYSRWSTEQASARLVRQHEPAHSSSTPSNALITELRSNHCLSYDQLQLLKQGKATEAATSVAAVRRGNGLNMLFWTGPLCGKLFLSAWLTSSLQIPPVIVLTDFFAAGCVCLMVVLAALRELRIASRLLEKVKAVSAEMDRCPAHESHDDHAALVGSPPGKT